VAFSADAIVVLGCRILPSGVLTAVAARRAAEAASAFLAGAAPIVVASGGRRWGAQIEARALGAELVRRGVAEEAIALELWSLTTCENAIFSAALLRRLGAERAGIVTCGWHMARALQNFRDAGITAIPLPAASPPSGPLRRLYRRSHELVCERLDARTMRRARVLHERAEQLAAIGVPRWIAEAAREVQGAVMRDEGEGEGLDRRGGA
jgi:uncharacterized SAM-binding protein YcdF (DUF218 family)